MCDRKARWAMWSIGAIANRVIVEMAESDALEVVAVCSSSEEKAKDFIQKNNLPAKAYTNIDDILKRDDIDVVYIASPPWLHREQCCRCMDAGKAVLCEKPMTLDPEDAIAIFECAKKNHVFMAEGVWTNYFPAMIKAKEWIAEGRIGEPVEVVSTFGFPILTEFADPDGGEPPYRWSSKLSNGGGALSEFGVYNINLAQFVFGQAPEAIYGTACRASEDPDAIDINSEFILSYEQGAKRALISCGMTARTITQSVISGTKGTITIGSPFFAPVFAREYHMAGSPFCHDVTEEFRDPYAEKHREGFKFQFEAVSRYVLEGKTESLEVPYEYSINLAKTVKRVREQLGLTIHK